MKSYLTPSEIHTVMHALSVAAERFGEHEAALRTYAARIRGGEVIEPFAAGEGGAWTVERLANQHAEQVADCRALRDKIEEAGSVVLETEES